MRTPWDSELRRRKRAFWNGYLAGFIGCMFFFLMLKWGGFLGLCGVR